MRHILEGEENTTKGDCLIIYGYSAYIVGELVAIIKYLVSPNISLLCSDGWKAYLKL
jgi:hypothetical protein